eukprot:1117834-Amphidinium_carterae.1
MSSADSSPTESGFEQGEEEPGNEQPNAAATGASGTGQNEAAAGVPDPLDDPQHDSARAR